MQEYRLSCKTVMWLFLRPPRRYIAPSIRSVCVSSRMYALIRLYHDVYPFETAAELLRQGGQGRVKGLSYFFFSVFLDCRIFCLSIGGRLQGDVQRAEKGKKNGKKRIHTITQCTRFGWTDAVVKWIPSMTLFHTTHSRYYLEDAFCI